MGKRAWKRALEGESSKTTAVPATTNSHPHLCIDSPLSRHHVSKGVVVIWSLQSIRIWEAEEDFLNTASLRISSPKQQAFIKC